MRVKAVIAYDGSIFYGFQKQTSTPHTVTHAIEKVLASLQIHSPVVGSGRTDRGVHATGQVIHFDLPEFWQDLSKLQHILNNRLKAISFKHISFVSETFHARFSAKRRYYRYIFKTKPLSVFEQNYVGYYEDGFDTEILHKALDLLIGEHDFKWFHKTGSDTHTTIRTLYRTVYYRHASFHIIAFEANGFLRSQVRMMVEAAMQCALGKLTLDALYEQLTCQRQSLATLAPAQGLYLARISY
jgi:tRNA pseudouridine38-40 synthase